MRPRTIFPLIVLLAIMMLSAPVGGGGQAPCPQAPVTGGVSLLNLIIPPVMGCPSPRFTITANPVSLTIAMGNTGKSTISLSSLENFNGTITMTTSPPPVCPQPGCSTWSISPASVSLKPNGTATSTLAVFAGTSWPGPGKSGNVTVYGTSANQTRTVVVTFTTVAAPNFTISANPSSLTVPTGAQGNSTITLTSLGGFTGTLTVSVMPPPLCPGCTGWSISRTSLTLPANGTATSTLTIFAGTFTGSGSVNVTGTSGSLSHSTVVTFQVVQATNADFSISANPAHQTVQAGSTATSQIILASINGFSGAINLTPPVSCLAIGCPTISLNPTTVIVSPGGTGPSTLTFGTSTSTPSGNFTVSITGTSGSLSHTVNVLFTVVGSAPDYSMTANPTSFGITQGSCGSSTITLASLNGFNGAISLTSTISPSGPTTTLSPTIITLPPFGIDRSSLTVCATSSTPTGTYTVTVTGTSGSISHVVAISVTVSLAPDFTITASPSSQSIQKGSSTTFTITVKGTNNFNGTVSLVATVSPAVNHGPAVSLPSTVGPYSTSTLTVFTSRNTPVGTYTITITATSGSLTHTVTVTLTVTR